MVLLFSSPDCPSCLTPVPHPTHTQEHFTKIRECVPEREALLQLERHLLQNAAAVIATAPVIDSFLRELDFSIHGLGAVYLLCVGV